MRSKVACTVREGAGYFANPPISLFRKALLSDQECRCHFADSIPELEKVGGMAVLLRWGM